MKYWFGKILFVLILSVILISCTSLSNYDSANGMLVKVDAERLTGDSRYYLGENDVKVSGGKQQSDLTSVSGKYSTLTLPQTPYSFSFEVSHAQADAYYVVDVWRKAKHGKGVIVMADKTQKFYLASHEVVEKGKNGWEKLELQASVPPNLQGQKIVFYVWNNGKDSVFFDDFRIQKYDQRTYPDYPQENLTIELGSKALKKLQNKRIEAFGKGILQAGDHDWVKGMLLTSEDVLKAKLRLKGDWLDHLVGSKWSFRIKMKKQDVWNRLRVFSVQTPEARTFIYEWIVHQLFFSKDVLTTRYGFIPLKLNQKSLGLYAWEEHFTKQLIEFHRRREGPIIRLSEDVFWQLQYLYKTQKGDHSLPYYEAAEIKPFGTKQILKNEKLFKQFEEASKLLKQHKYAKTKVSEIFDLNQLAMYFALLDLTQALHGSAWHNQRFYFNPITEKLEIVGYDGNIFMQDIHWDISDFSYHKAVSSDIFFEEDLMKIYIFEDTVFVSKYLDALQQISDSIYISSMMNSMDSTIAFYNNLIAKEFRFYHYDKDFFVNRAKFIRDYLPALEKFVKDNPLSMRKMKLKKRPLRMLEEDKTPEFLLHAYLGNRQADKYTIQLESYLPKPVEILGVGAKKNRLDSESNNLRLESFNNDGAVQAHFDIYAEKPAFLFFRIVNQPKVYSVEILPWAIPQGLTSRQKLMQNVKVDSYRQYAAIEGNIISFSGQNTIDKPIVIPEGYSVLFKAGTQLDFVNGAFFLSFSPVKVKGTKDKPVLLSSPDHSAKGFSILQPYGKCSIENLIFKGFDTFAYEKWNLSGAFTIYEGDGVEINNVQFVDNQCEDALNLVRSSFKISDCTFEHTWGDAFDADFCTGHITDSRFVNIGNDAIDYSGSEITVSHCEIYQANDKGISGGEESHLKIEDCTIESANIGIASKDLSQLEVVNTQIASCRYGLVLLQKKPEYGPATIRISGSKIENTPEEYLIEKGSELILDGRLIFGLEKKLAKKFY